MFNKNADKTPKTLVISAVLLSALFTLHPACAQVMPSESGTGNCRNSSYSRVPESITSRGLVCHEASSVPDSERLSKMATLVGSKDEVVANADNSPFPLRPEQIFYVDFKDVAGDGPLPDLFNDKELARAVAQGLVKIERAPAGAFIKFLYNKGPLSQVARKLTSLKFVSRMVGRYNNGKASEKDILEFMKNVLKINVNKENIAEINRQFHSEYGMGIDQFLTINEIFARKYTPERIEEHLKSLGAKEGDVLSNSTARLRIIPSVDINEPFHLTDKSIGGTMNQFRIGRLFGQGEGQEEVDSDHADYYVKKLIGFMQEISEKGRRTSSLHLSDEDIMHVPLLDRKEKEMAIKKNSESITDPILMNAFLPLLSGSTMLVNRLAPEDYHNIHFPFTSGKVLGKAELAEKLENFYLNPEVQKKVPSELLKIYHTVFNFMKWTAALENEDSPAFHIDGGLFSVSTIATTTEAMKFNPLTENMRDIVFLDTPEYGIVPLVIIGATGVGKNVIDVKAGEHLKAGDNMGHFEFGASTTVMFLPKDKATPYPATKRLMDLKFEVPLSSKDQDANVKAVRRGESPPNKGTVRMMETLVEMGQPLFHKAEPRPSQQ